MIAEAREVNITYGLGSKCLPRSDTFHFHSHFSGQSMSHGHISKPVGKYILPWTYKEKSWGKKKAEIPFPTSRQPLIRLPLSLQSFFPECTINELLPCVAFCVWLFWDSSLLHLLRQCGPFICWTVFHCMVIPQLTRWSASSVSLKCLIHEHVPELWYHRGLQRVPVQF